MKYKHLILLVVLALAVVMTSGCDFSWLGELIPNIPGSTTDPVKGVLLGVEQFQLNADENQFILQGLDVGETLLLAVSPYNPATVAGVNYDLRVSVERVEAQAAEGFVNTEHNLLTKAASEYAGREVATEIQSTAIPPAVVNSDDYYSYIGDPAGLNTAQASAEMTLQGTNRTFYVKTEGSYQQVEATLIRDSSHIAIYANIEVQVGTDYVEQINETFNYTIYPKVTQSFGFPWDKDSNGKVILLITPLRYEGSDTKLVGYFDEINLYDQAEENYSNAADMFYLNANILGGNMSVVYGNLAHEFQHLVFAGAKLQAWRDTPSGPRFSQYYTDIWINEGFSMLAAHLSGFVNLETDGRIYHSTYGYFAEPHRDGLLTWDNNRPDSNYGSAGLFGYYLYDHYKSVIKTILNESQTPEETIALYTGKAFPVVFQNWMIANMVDRMTNVNDLRYRYSSLDLQGAPVYVALQDEDRSDIWGMGVRYYRIEGDGRDLQITFTKYFGDTGIPILNGALIFFKPAPE